MSSTANKIQLDLSAIKDAVQKNCHIADANAAGNYTMCIYLLKMLEFYRWESGYDYGDNIPREEVGNWLREREELWEGLHEQEFEKIAINGQEYDPFDAEAINRNLLPQHLVYSAGLGRNTRPHFFLGVLEKHQQHDKFNIIVVADEYARDLTSPPAMSQGNTIYIRREAFRRMLWEQYEQWLWNKPDNALGRALKYYPFDSDLDKALDEMTHNELNAAVLHEIGEIKAHACLGNDWEELLLQSSHSKLEYLLRAVRDHYADCLSTLPELITQQHDASLHFYVGNLSNMRKDLFPALVSAYEIWHKTGDLAPMREVADKGLEHWGQLCKSILRIASEQSDDMPGRLIKLIEQHKL